jgi:hypothetical protein
VRELAREIEQLNQRVANLDRQLGQLLRDYDNPLADLPGAGPAVTVAVLAHQATSAG